MYNLAHLLHSIRKQFQIHKWEIWSVYNFCPLKPKSWSWHMCNCTHLQHVFQDVWGNARKFCVQQAKNKNATPIQNLGILHRCQCTQMAHVHQDFAWSVYLHYVFKGNLCYRYNGTCPDWQSVRLEIKLWVELEESSKQLLCKTNVTEWCKMVNKVHHQQQTMNIHEINLHIVQRLAYYQGCT